MDGLPESQTILSFQAAGATSRRFFYDPVLDQNISLTMGLATTFSCNAIAVT
jgi:hypothetical protein